MFHFSYSKQSRAFNKLNWADWHSQETYMNLLNWYSHWLHTKTCIHLVVNQSYHNYSDNWCFIQHKDDICVFSSCDAFSLFSHKFVWMMSWCSSLIYSPILLMLNECKVHLTSKYVTLVTARQCQPKFFLLVYLHKLK